MHLIKSSSPCEKHWFCFTEQQQEMLLEALEYYHITKPTRRTPFTYRPRFTGGQLRMLEGLRMQLGR